jgi:Uma2 family endonuclease
VEFYRFCRKSWVTAEQPRARHEKLAGQRIDHAEAARILCNHLTEQPHCRVVAGPGVQPRAGRDNYNIRVSDLAVTSEPVSPSDRLLRAPLLIVEILSPADWRRTWANVSLYTTISSVREILVLHTADIRAVLLWRKPDGMWPTIPRRWRPALA